MEAKKSCFAREKKTEMDVTSLWLIIMMSSLAFTKPAEGLPKDCCEVTESRTGLYRIDPDGKGAIKVFCDMKTDGGGWTVFQRRINNKEDFSRNWTEYRNGFGRLGRRTSFWLGNENLHRLTFNRRVALRVELEAWDHPHKTFTTTYQKFNVGDEASLYQITLSKGKGSAGDALRPHRSMYFSTKDKDNDKSKSNCAERFKGGWWYKSCLYCNLNGEYINREDRAPHHFGIVWQKKKLGEETSLKFSEMKLKPLK